MLCESPPLEEMASVSTPFRLVIEMKLHDFLYYANLLLCANCGNIGKETISAATFSATGKSPFR